jgi:hypothetical protein
MTDRQLEVCARFGVVPTPAPGHMLVGISQNVRSGLMPVNGLRHAAEGNTTGWFIWAGEELSDAPDFFRPLHVDHLVDWCPGVIPYLQLPPGWRFLVAPGVEDVWWDPGLLSRE